MLRLVISSDDDGGPDDDELERWYTSLGFVKQGFSWYVRVPEWQANVARTEQSKSKPNATVAVG